MEPLTEDQVRYAKMLLGGFEPDPKDAELRVVTPDGDILNKKSVEMGAGMYVSVVPVFRLIAARKIPERELSDLEEVLEAPEEYDVETEDQLFQLQTQYTTKLELRVAPDRASLDSGFQARYAFSWLPTEDGKGYLEMEIIPAYDAVSIAEYWGFKV